MLFCGSARPLMMPRTYLAPEKSGIFTVRSAYNLGVDSVQQFSARGASSARPDGSDPCWDRIWKRGAPPKVKVFAWKAASNALATEENKRCRSMDVTGICSICELETEDVPVVPLT